MIRIDFNRLRFLVIDDNAHMRRIVRTLLHGFGARDVYEAEDGAAGLDAFTHHIPDIVMTIPCPCGGVRSIRTDAGHEIRR